MSTTANQLDLSLLTPASRRAVRDYYEFLLSSSEKTEKTRTAKYKFADLCGGLSWKDDAMAEQQRLRDEW